MKPCDQAPEKAVNQCALKPRDCWFCKGARKNQELIKEGPLCTKCKTALSNLTSFLGRYRGAFLVTASGESDG